MELELLEKFNRRKFMSSMKFHNFGNYLPSETASPFIWTHNVGPLHPSNCSKFDWNWLSILEKKFFNIVNLFLQFFFQMSSMKFNIFAITSLRKN